MLALLLLSFSSLLEDLCGDNGGDKEVRSLDLDKQNAILSTELQTSFVLVKKIDFTDFKHPSI